MTVARHSIIAKEGQLAILLSLLLTSCLYIQFGPYTLPVALIALPLIWLYRDPDRRISSRPLAIVSPVDGKVVSVEATRDRFLKRDALHIAIDMSVGGAFSLRSVTEGRIMQIWQEQNGHGHCLAIWVQTDEQNDTVLVLRPGRWLKRLSYQLACGDRIGHGQRFGHILFGNRIDVYLPASSRSTIAIGQDVKAGCDGIAELMHS